MTPDEVNGLLLDPKSQKQHCWDFARRIQLEYFNRDYPSVGPVNLKDLKGVLRTFKTQVPHILADATKVPNPREGDFVAMSNNGDVAHCGIYLELDGGGVLHRELNKRPSFTKLRALPYRHVWFYRP